MKINYQRVTLKRLSTGSALRDKLTFCHVKHKLCINNILWTQSHLKWTDTKWKNVLWSDNATIEKVFGFMDFVEKDHPSHYQSKVQKSCVMEWGGVPAVKPHSVRLTTVWLHNKRVHVQDWSACSPDLPPH